jgi:hypothetical protein
MMMMKSLVVKFLCFVILLSSFVACETDHSKPPNGQQHKQQQSPHSKAKEIDDDDGDDDGKLPNLWDDEVVNRMVREILARDLAKENSHNLLKSRYRRDVSTTATSETAAARKVPSTTRKSSATPKSSRKPVRQTSTNKNKNRVTQSSTIAASTTSRATVKPSTKPTSIVTSTTFGTNSLKAKVRSLILVLNKTTTSFKKTKRSVRMRTSKNKSDDDE